MLFFSEADHPVALFASRVLARAGYDVWVGDRSTLCPPGGVGVYTSAHATKSEFMFKCPGSTGLGIHTYPAWIVPCWRCISIPRFQMHDACSARTHLLDAFVHFVPELEARDNMPPW